MSKHVVSHHVFTPPCEFTKLSDKDMKQFLWLSKNYHKFLFYSGDVPYQRLTPILETMRYERMFVKGLEKYLYLKNLGYKVYLLDEKMESLKKSAETTHCNYHDETAHCALKNVYSLYNFHEKQ